MPLMKLPSGPGGPAPDAAQALAQATAACRHISTITAEIAVSGTIRGRRVRGRLLVGLAPPASARLEAVAPFGQPLFIFAARQDDATVFLPRDNRVLEHGPTAAILEATTGLPLDAAELRRTLTACVAAPDPARARSLGESWRLVPDGSHDAYLHRDGSGMWHVAAVVHHDPAHAEWRAEHGDVQNGLPRSIRLTRAGPDGFDVRLEASQVETNVPLDADVFRIQVPKSAESITLDELKQAGPLASPEAHGR